ncbi:MAG: hemerythrin domain-containing protein [Mycobacterium sp.]
MDAIEMLEGEHRDVEELFSRYNATEHGAERREIVSNLARNLTKHAALKEDMLYPLMIH